MIPIDAEDLPPESAGGRGTDRFTDIMTASLGAVMVLQYRQQGERHAR